jgi:hypothetical protein
MTAIAPDTAEGTWFFPKDKSDEANEMWHVNLDCSSVAELPRITQKANQILDTIGQGQGGRGPKMAGAS